MLGKREYLLKLEYNLMLGGGRWVADFKESFWNFSFNEVIFEMMICGGMRPKGFALSRLASTLLMPNYQAACFAYPDDPGLKRLPGVLKAVQRYMKDKEIKWSWVVVPCESAFSPQARASVEKNEVRDLGIALVNLQTQEITSSRSYIGRRMARFVNTFK
jgi:hypothetical protein